ncbi:hypothetical protein [Archangium lipolyticum]|uniref:hypothetical protein n=1 Tax=Archangium lipolyticum TaxID=2970465 RepID=UPI00214A56D6|nr:hypothetical protein [Archangium lipolyticum]
MEALARKSVARLRLAARPCFATVRLGGSPHVMGILSLVLLLLGRDYQRIIVVFDTRTTNRRRIAAILEEIRAPLIKGGVVERVTLVPVVPSIENWVLADEKALERAAGAHFVEGVPRGGTRPDEFLSELLGGWGPKQQKQIARALEPERIRVNDSSFDAFVRALHSSLEEQAHLSAEQESAAPS